MASSPSPPLPPEAEPAPLPGVGDVAAGLGSARRSSIAAIGGRLRPQIGALARSASRLGGSFGLPISLRRRAVAGGVDLGGYPVRPPDYWVGHEPEDPDAKRLPSTGDAAWDRLISRVRGQARQQAPARRAPAQRGLPSTVHRKGTSVVGPLTAPGGMARRMAVSTLAPAPNPANSPTAARQAAVATTTHRRQPPAPARSKTSRAAVRQPASTRTGATPPDIATAQQMLRKLRGEEPPRADEPTQAPAPPSPDRSRSAATSDPGTAGGPAARLLRRLRGDAAATHPVSADRGGTDATAPVAHAAGGDTAVPLATTSGGHTSGQGDGGFRPGTPRWWPTDAAAPAGTAGAGAAADPIQRSPAPGAALALRRLSGWSLPVAGPSAALAQAGIVPGGTGHVGGELRRTALGLRWFDDATGVPVAATAGLPVASPVLRRTATAPAAAPVAPRSATVPAAAPGRTSADATADASVLRRAATVDSPTPTPRPAASEPSGAPGRPPADGPPALAPHPGDAASGDTRDAAGRRSSRSEHAAAHGGGPSTPAAPPAPSSITAARPAAPAWPGRLFAGGAALGPAVTTGHAVAARISRMITAGGAAGRVATTSVTGLPMTPPALLPTPSGATSAAPAPVRRSARPDADRPAAPAAPSRPGAAPSSLAAGARATTGATPDLAGAAALAGRPDVRSLRQQLPGGFAAAGGIHRSPLLGTMPTVGVQRTLLPGSPAPVAGLPTGAGRPPAAAASTGPNRASGHEAADGTSPEPAGRRRLQLVRDGGQEGAAGLVHPAPGATGAAAGGFDAAGAAPAVGRLSMAPPAIVTGAHAGSPAGAAARSGASPASAVGGRHHHAHLTAVPAPAGGAIGAGPVVHRRPGHVARTPHEVRSAARAALTSSIQRPEPAATVGLVGRLPAAPGGAALRSVGAATAVGDGTATARDTRAGGRGPADTPAAKVERFQQILRQSGPLRTAPLPERFRPLADRIVGRRQVQVSTGEVSRKALAAVGTQAATTGNVVHLARALDTSTESLSVLAHELTHVAAPSAVPRFHGGAPSGEERRADRIEGIVARATRSSARGRGPVDVGTAGLPVGGPLVVQRSAAPTDEVVQRAAAAVAGGAPASAGTGRRATWTAQGHGDIQRTPSGGSAAPATHEAPAPDTIQRRAATDPGRTGTVESEEVRDVISEQVLAEIVRKVEDRLLEEIERRGGVWRGGW